MLFDFSWNIPDLRNDNVFDEEHPPRNKLGVPDEAWFFEPRDQIWRGDKTGRFKSNCLDICEYDKAMIYICDNNEISMYHPDELLSVRHERNFKPKSEIFYSAVSTEVGNWSHKWYTKSIPLHKFRLHTIIINNKKVGTIRSSEENIGLASIRREIYEEYKSKKTYINILDSKNLSFFKLLRRFSEISLPLIIFVIFISANIQLVNF